MLFKILFFLMLGHFPLQAAITKRCAETIRLQIQNHKANPQLVQSRIKEAVTEAFGDSKFTPSEGFMKKVFDYIGANTEFLKLDREQQISQLGDLLNEKKDVLNADEMKIMKAYLLEKNMREYNHLYGQSRYGQAFVSAMKKLMRPENYNSLFLMGADKILSARELQLLDYKWNVGLSDADIARVLPRGDGKEGEMQRNQVGVAYQKAMRRIRTAFAPLYVQEAFNTGAP